jgi:hypothetical protein
VCFPDGTPDFELNGRELNMSMSDSPAPGTPTKEELKQAFKAFKKRLKLTRLDEESNISGGPMSKGKGSGIVAIIPPNQFSPAVWEELARQGKIKYAGQGTYELAEE